ncbi:unnamed protein product [Amoebophrya sp. A25]|nr:unnamed protein product [Amoebophrya sp. A25]|eukprot:GSA25T00019621001.1
MICKSLTLNNIGVLRIWILSIQEQGEKVVNPSWSSL